MPSATPTYETTYSLDVPRKREISRFGTLLKESTILLPKTFFANHCRFVLSFL